MYEWIAPCHFGLEAVCKKEITDLGYEIVSVEDGRVTFRGGADACARANMFLRTAERVMLKVAAFEARTFDELFEKTKAIAWEQYIPVTGKFWVTKATSVKSTLFSPSDIQSIMKKAMVERMKQVYHLSRFPETGAAYPVRVSLMKDVVTIALDTSGDSLHRRGYRKLVSKAPITETLAAALIMLTPWRPDRILVDPFCGSGTFLIEAAMMAAGMAPGMNRSFRAEEWENLIPKTHWYRACDEAADLVREDVRTDIQGYDIDGSVIRAARENARLAGVEKLIHFQERPVSALSHPKKYGFLITNPPYGERLEERENLPALYRTLGERFAMLDSWSAFIITAYDGVERDMGRRADKNRKIYNGMMKTHFYQFMGSKPPRRQERQPACERIVFATGNENKMKEVRKLLAGTGLPVLSMKEAGLSLDIEETGTTFEENALCKARAVYEALSSSKGALGSAPITADGAVSAAVSAPITAGSAASAPVSAPITADGAPAEAGKGTGGTIVLADDSGLEVDYLQGAPGIYSARYMGEDTSYEVKCASIIEKLEKATGKERSARFRCVIAAVFPDGTEKTCEAAIEGVIARKPAGDGGFGYDPILYVPELDKTTAQLSMEEKNAISHRGKALRAMSDILEAWRNKR